MDTERQLFVFLICVAVGFGYGIVYEPFYLIGRILGGKREKRKILRAVLDVTYFIGFAFVHIYAAYWFHFPSFRVYMWIGYAVGWIIYLKTLRRIVAFLQNVCYNRITKLVKRQKNERKTLKKRLRYDAR